MSLEPSYRAGLNITQGKYTALLATSAGSSKTLTLPYANTTEKGGSSSFYLVLHSKPTARVQVLITSQMTNPTGGTKRIEGIPKGSTYLLKSSRCPLSNSSSYSQTVSNTLTGNLRVNFTNSNWNKTQKVTIYGLDDNYADGDVEYYVYLKVSSTDSNYAGGTFTLPFWNHDDDVAGMVSTRRGTTCSEPYYNLVSYIDFTLKSQPLYPVTIGLSSSWTQNADVGTKFFEFDSQNYYTSQTVKISCIDNFVVDGSRPFRVIATVLNSYDPTYLSLGQFGNWSYTAIDDPGTMDTTYTAKAKLNITLNLVQGTLRATSAAGGSVWLTCTLPIKPQVGGWVHTM